MLSHFDREDLELYGQKIVTYFSFNRYLGKAKRRKLAAGCDTADGDSERTEIGES